MGFSKLLTVLVLLHYTTGVLGAVVKSSIIGGENAEKGEWPFMVHLNISTADGSTRWRCGGALLDDEWVVTAAHCFKTDPKPDLSRTVVWVGSHQLRKGAERYRSVVHCIDSAYRLCREADNDFENDIALISLNKKVKFTANIAPIRLPADDSPIDSSSECWITGWGDIGKNVSLPEPETLQKLKVSILSQSRCKEAYNQIDTRTMLCAEAPEGKGACNGDYGGPLVCRGSKGFTLVGIMSYGGPSGCGGTDRPIVFAQVSKYLKFIKNYVKPPYETSADV